MDEAIRKADILIEALPYIRRFARRPVVVKFGGSPMESAAVLDDVLHDIVFLATVGIRTIVVHGGGPQISEAMKQAGLEPKFVEGHRVTDAETLQVAVRVLSEEISADIVRRIRAWGGRARPGYSGGRSLLRARRKLMRATVDGVPRKIDVGFVGEVHDVDLWTMLDATDDGSVLVLPPIGQDEGGQLYNVNADTAAAAVAGALKAEKLVFLSNVHGIMTEPGNPDSFISSVPEEQVEAMIRDGVISGGMLPKVAACVRAIDAGVRKAHIIDGRLPHSLLLEIFTDKGVGTEILKSAPPAGA